MSKFSMVILVLALAGSGCTTCSLERHTLNQIRTSGDFRSQEAVNCIASVAANPDAVPSFALLADGLTRLQDTGTINAVTTWTRALGGFSTQNLGVTAARSPQAQWTLGPTVEHERLEALRCACRWVLYGPDSAWTDSPGLLSSLEQDPLPRPHFGVAERIARMPQGWLHVGQLKDVPLSACYKGHCGDVWVWVMPDGMEGLSEFTLVLHDIATLDLSAVYAPPPLVTLTKQVPTKLKDAVNSNAPSLSYQETRVIKPQFKDEIQRRIRDATDNGGNVAICWEQWMCWTDPYRGARTNVNPQGPGATSPQGSPKPPFEPQPGEIPLPVVEVDPNYVELQPGGPSEIIKVAIKGVTVVNPLDIEVNESDLPEGVKWLKPAKPIGSGNVPGEITLQADKMAKSMSGTKTVRVSVFTVPPHSGRLSAYISLGVPK
jgi:hypothetical protein